MGKHKTGLTIDELPKGIHTKTVSDFQYKIPINNEIIKPEQIKGYDIINKINFVAYLAASKGSGKSTLIYNLIRAKTDKTTKIIIFCATVNSDPSYVSMIKKLEQKGYTIVSYTDIIEKDENNQDVNIVDEFIRDINASNEVVKEEAPIEAPIKFYKD